MSLGSVSESEAPLNSGSQGGTGRGLECSFRVGRIWHEEVLLFPTDDEHVWEDDGHAGGAAQEPQHQGLAGPHAGLGHHLQIRCEGCPSPGAHKAPAGEGLQWPSWADHLDLSVESPLLIPSSSADPRVLTNLRKRQEVAFCSLLWELKVAKIKSFGVRGPWVPCAWWLGQSSPPWLPVAWSLK